MDKLQKLNLIFISLLTIIGAVVYKIYLLDLISVIIILILAILIFFIILHLLNKYNTSPEKIVFCIKRNDSGQKKPFDYLFPVIYLIFIGICCFILFNSATNEAIISPWQKVPNYFFLFYFLASLSLSLIILNKKPFAKVLIIAHYLLSFSVVLIVYKIGYGFDPFIHQATEKLISQTGAVHPKPFYYLGQYALITILNKITFIPIAWLDKLLVPIFAALVIPTSLILTLSKWLEDKTTILFTVFLLPILPYSFFIVSTPQNLAYIFLILILIYSLYSKNNLDLINISLLSLAAFAVHPLAGIPAILFALTIIIHYKKSKYQKYFYSAIFLLMILALPLAFLLFQQGTDTNSIDPQATISPILSWPEITIPNQENAILNTVYLYILNFKIIYFILTLAGFVIILKNKKECRVLFLYLFSSLAFFASYLLSTRLSFGFLIDYERGDYSNRILTIAVIFLIPLTLLAIHKFLLKLSNQNKIVKFGFIILFCTLLSISLYASYPRFDNYFNSHGYSVSQNDIEAVHWIKNDAKNDYIVLANQQVSAASLREFGFKKYFKAKEKNHADIFYYPIPTGGPLYRLYLDMVYEKPERETIKKALDLTGAKTGYFVLNKYWWAFPKILAEAKLEADSWTEIGEGEVFVFKYILGN